jgi:hypothetical protein
MKVREDTDPVEGTDWEDNIIWEILVDNGETVMMEVERGYKFWREIESKDHPF